MKDWFTSFPEHHRRPRDTSSVTDQHDHTNLTCPSYVSCLGSRNCTTEMDPGLASKYERCFCDKYCEMFQDCCADYAEACINTSRRLGRSDVREGQWQCHRENSSYKSVWMISLCPATNSTPVKIKENCFKPLQNQLKDIVPVKDSKGITYKNRFCALCHGIPANETQFFDAELSCNDSVVTIEISNITENIYSNCSYIQWKIPESFPRRYCLKTRGNESCSLQSAFLREKCASSLPGIVRNWRVSGHYFLNPYCALCGNISFNDIRCGPYKRRRPPNQSTYDDVIAVNSDDVPQQNIVHCGPGRVYDIITRECRDTFDIDITPVVPFLYRYIAVVVLRSPVPLHQNTIANLKEAIRSRLSDSDMILLDINVRYENITFYSIDIKFAPQRPMPEDELNSPMNLALSFNISTPTGNNSLTTIKKTWQPLFCFKIETYKPGEYALMSSYHSAVYINSTGDVIPAVNYFAEDFEKQKVKNGSVIPNGNIQVCRRSQPLSNCSGAIIGLKEHEYTILPNGSLYRNQTRQSIDFLMLNGTAYICVHYSSYYKTTAKQPVSSELLDLLSFIGLCVSIPCLLLVLFTYSLFKELRSVPGLNLMNLAFSLLLTHSLLLGIKASHIKPLCTVIAVLLHYLYLVTFTWMSIIAFDTYRTFSRTCYSRRRANNCNNRFAALGWLPAFVFVVTCFNLDISGKVAIGYGDGEYCWIGNPRLNLFVFVIPVAFLVTFNVLVFFITVYSIQKVKKQTQHVVTLKNQTSVWLFVKLATLMGFTWIFGFLRILWSDYFAYPFVIFTSLQGVYIMVAFVFTPRIKNMYRDLFIAKKTEPVETYDTRL